LDAGVNADPIGIITIESHGFPGLDTAEHHIRIKGPYGNQRIDRPNGLSFGAHLVHQEGHISLKRGGYTGTAELGVEHHTL